jgi:hypothetical protein
MSGPEAGWGPVALVAEKAGQQNAFVMFESCGLPFRNESHHLRIAVEFGQECGVLRSETPQEHALGLKEYIAQT